MEKSQKEISRDYFKLTLTSVVFSIFFFNVLAIPISVAGLIMSFKSKKTSDAGDIKASQKYSRVALFLGFCGIVITLVTFIFVVILIIYVINLVGSYYNFKQLFN